MFQIDQSYVQGEHFVDDVQEEIDLIFEMFVYNKWKSNFVDQLEVSHDHVDDNKLNEFHNCQDQLSR